MKAAVSLLVLALGLGGCAQYYSADLSFARVPGLGFRNAGLYTPGYLFLWDARQNKLTKLQEDIFLAKQPRTDPPTDLNQTNIRGISITGEFGSSAEKVSAEINLGQKIEFRAEQAVRERYQSVYTALAQAYTEGNARGEDMSHRWYVKDVTHRGSGLYYVIITGIVRANKTTISYAGEEGPEIGSVSVTVPGKLGTIKVNVKNSNVAECSGKASPCFFDVMVVAPFINNSGRLDFESARNINKDKLSAAFRSL
jgi:hypothetical protein